MMLLSLCSVCLFVFFFGLISAPQATKGFGWDDLKRYASWFQGNVDEKAKIKSSPLSQEKLIASYKQHFRIKRTEQVKAVEGIFEIPEYHKRFNLIKPVLVGSALCVIGGV
eukprot:m.123996 g.123996  ORF g.123996 m.123996 type:complete len:111 (+) comp9419_c1_seq1:326-658(+)